MRSLVNVGMVMSDIVEGSEIVTTRSSGGLGLTKLVGSEYTDSERVCDMARRLEGAGRLREVVIFLPDEKVVGIADVDMLRPSKPLATMRANATKNLKIWVRRP